MSETIFSKIIRGEIPCHRVYEDAHTLAFLDVNPISRGHVLLIPKEPAVTIANLSDDAAAALGRVLPRICRAVVKTTGCIGYNLLQNNGSEAGQLVMHAHIHIIPRYDGDATGSGFSYQWRSTKLEAVQASELLAALKSNLS